MPQANEDGFFELYGERHGMIEAWSKELGISRPSITRRLEELKGIKGKDFRGKIWDERFHAESIVREKCADLLNRK